MKWDFKRTVNWSKYWSKATLQAQNEYLDYVIDSEIKLSFLFENNAVRAHNIFFPTIEIKDYSVLIKGKAFFDKEVKNDWKTW